MPLRLFAYLFSAAAVMGVALQVASVFGLPVVAFTFAGSFSGQAEWQVRGVAFAIAITLAVFAVIVLQAVGLTGKRRPPSWMLWGIVALTATAAVAQTSAPDMAARLLWIPLLVGMGIAAVLIVLRRGRRRVVQI
jgi:peptidoglycan/LPS O-acetylase OafA/YrhL